MVLTVAVLLIGQVTGALPSAWHAARILMRDPTGSSRRAVADLERQMAGIGETIRQRESQTEPAPTTPLLWPVPSTRRLEDGFGLRLHPVLEVEVMHAGVDIPAQAGEDIVAAQSGKVVRVQSLAAYGRIIIIDHGGKLATVYAHLSGVKVSEGQRVKQGDRIGQVGATGQVTGPHLHFEVRRDGDAVNPAEFISPDR